MTVKLDTHAIVVKFNKNINKRRALIIFALVTLFFGFMVWFIPPVWRLTEGSLIVTQPVGDKDDNRQAIGPQEKGWINMGEVSEHMLHAIIVAEDARFYLHHGLDFTEIEKSISNNFRKGRIARGASTITQQVVKMAFLTREKTLVRKSREALGALIKGVEKYPAFT